MKIDLRAMLNLMTENKPLIHHLTNWVTINDCAQITRHWGCLPVMAHAIEEVEEMAWLAGAVVLNIGTLTPDLVNSMIWAGQAANKKGIPVVLDAVGAGATKLRTEQAKRLLSQVKIGVIKGNAGEIATIAGVQAEVRGVESISVGGDVASYAKALAKTMSCVVCVTGKTDIVSDGSRTLAIDAGHPLMGAVVGTGCVSSSTVGCFAAVEKNILIAAAAAMGAFGIAGELAAKKSEGPGDFFKNLFNVISSLAADSAPFAVEVREI